MNIFILFKIYIYDNDDKDIILHTDKIPLFSTKTIISLYIYFIFMIKVFYEYSIT